MRGHHSHPGKLFFFIKSKSTWLEVAKIYTDDEETSDEESSEDDEETTEEESTDDKSVHYLFCSFIFIVGGWQKFLHVWNF